MTSVLEILSGVGRESLALLYQMAPYLLFGFFFAGLLHVFVTLDSVAKHLGRSSIGSVLKSVLFGIPLPLCSCGVIPAAVLLKKKGASRGAVISFLISTPITGIDSIFATYSLLGPFFTIYRIIASAVTAFVAGVAANFLLPRGAIASKASGTLASPHHCHVCGSEDPQQHEARRHKTHRRIAELFRYAFVELLGDIWRWLLLGLIIAGIISYAVPEELIERYLGSSFSSMLIMMLVGIPMYVCATGSLPIAAALMFKGMSPGAAMVFLLAGPATNAVTITVVARELGKGAATLYVLSIAAMSLVTGAILNWIWTGGGYSMDHRLHSAAMLPHWVESVSAWILIALMVVSMWRELRARGVKS